MCDKVALAMDKRKRLLRVSARSIGAVLLNLVVLFVAFVPLEIKHGIGTAVGLSAIEHDANSKVQNLRSLRVVELEGVSMRVFAPIVEFDHRPQTPCANLKRGLARIDDFEPLIVPRLLESEAVVRHVRGPVDNASARMIALRIRKNDVLKAMRHVAE